MNLKFLILFLSILGVLSVGYYLYNNQNKVKNAPVQTNTSYDLKYPVRPDKVGVRSVSIVYNFFGRVAKIEKEEENTKFILDNADYQTPDFITGPTTGFFKISGNISEAPTPAKLGDVKQGDYVELLMVYYPKTISWELRGVSILPGSPSASPK